MVGRVVTDDLVEKGRLAIPGKSVPRFKKLVEPALQRVSHLLLSQLGLQHGQCLPAITLPYGHAPPPNTDLLLSALYIYLSIACCLADSNLAGNSLHARGSPC